jgi:DNA-binding NarL/FixJ family response regulator
MSPAHTTPTPARVLIVDDHLVLCRSIRRHLEQDQDLTVCGVIQEAAEVPQAVEELNPDVVLLDLTLGDEDGLSVARSLRTHYRELPILILSIHRESLYAEPALKAGANGYLMKSDASENLLTALHTVLEGQTYLSAGLAQRLRIHSDN